MIESEIEQLLAPLIHELGFVLWGCCYLRQGKQALLRVYIDKKDGIKIEDCEVVASQINALIDVEDPISGNYTLEVSSPGIPRPLFKKEHYELYKGCDIQMKLHKALKGYRKLFGRLVDINDGGVVLKMDEELFEIPFSLIVKANLTGE